MANANSFATAPAEIEDFAALLDETLGADTGFAGSVVTGKVIRIDDDYAVVDVGLKSEGRVPLKEFAPQGQKAEVQPGDVIELFVERYEDRDGAIVLSREKARREEAWTNLEKAFTAQQRVERRHLQPGQGWLHRRSRRRRGLPAAFAGRHPPRSATSAR
jgi:small subunit ribosomal protein S1